MPDAARAITLRTSRPEAVEIAGREMRSEVLAVIVSQEVLDGEDARDEAVLRDLLQKRNRSIPACGLELRDGDAALGFLEYVDGLVSRSEGPSVAAHAILKGL